MKKGIFCTLLFMSLCSNISSAQNTKWSTFIAFREDLFFNTPYSYLNSEDDLKMAFEAGVDKKINRYWGIGLSMESQRLRVNNENLYRLSIGGISSSITVRNQLKVNFQGFRISPFICKDFDLLSLSLRPSVGFFMVNSSVQLPVTIDEPGRESYQNTASYIFKNTWQIAGGIGMECSYRVYKNFAPFLTLNFTGTYTNKRQNEVKSAKKIPIEDLQAYNLVGTNAENWLNTILLEYGPFSLFQLGVGLRYHF